MSLFGDIASIVGSLFGSSMEADAAKDAAKLQTAAADRAIAEQRRQFDTTRADMEPWLASGRNSLRVLDALLGTSGGIQPMSLDQFKLQFNQPVGRDWLPQELANINAQYQTYLQGIERANAKNPPKLGPLLQDFTLADFEADPGYQFRLSEGAKAIENSAAARGMQLSGATLKGLARYGQDFASNEFDRAYNRDSLNKQRTYNFLTGQSGSGLQTASNLGSMGTATAGNIADTYLQVGNARAAGKVGAANAWTNGIRDITSYYQMRNLLRDPWGS